MIVFFASELEPSKQLRLINEKKQYLLSSSTQFLVKKKYIYDTDAGVFSFALPVQPILLQLQWYHAKSQDGSTIGVTSLAPELCGEMDTPS